MRLIAIVLYILGRAAKTNVVVFALLLQALP